LESSFGFFIVDVEATRRKPDIYVTVQALYEDAAAANGEELQDGQDLLAMDDNEVDEDGAPVAKPKTKRKTGKEGTSKTVKSKIEGSRARFTRLFASQQDAVRQHGSHLRSAGRSKMPTSQKQWLELWDTGVVSERRKGWVKTSNDDKLDAGSHSNQVLGYVCLYILQQLCLVTLFVE